MKDCLQEATGEEDTDRVLAIKKVIERETVRKRWTRVNHSTKKARGRPPVAVRVATPDQGYEEFMTEDEVFLQVSRNLLEQFRLAFTAPSCSGKLFDDIGFLGDTQAVKEILEGTYVFEPDVDPATNYYWKKRQSHMHQCQKKRWKHM